MKSRLSIKSALDKIRRHCKSERFDRALADADRLLLKSPDNSSLLVLRAGLIQLQSDSDGSPTLADAKADLVRAVELNDHSPNALIELAFFLFSVEDDPKAALKYFRKATTMSRHLLRESLLGQADVLVELGKGKDARLCVIEAKCVRSHNVNSPTPAENRGIQDRLKSSAHTEGNRLTANRS